MFFCTSRVCQVRPLASLPFNSLLTASSHSPILVRLFMEVDKRLIMGVKIKEMIFPLLLATLYVFAIRTADLFAGCSDRDNHRVIVYRSIFTCLYSALVVAYFHVDIINVNGVLKWSVKTALVLAFPLITELKSTGFNDPFHVVRDYIVAPICEELVFRGPLHGYLMSSLSFSLAHLNRGLPWEHAIAQLVITFLFGVYSYHVRVTTGSILACVIVHAICNFSGPPNFSDMMNPRDITIQTILILLAIWL